MLDQTSATRGKKEIINWLVTASERCPGALATGYLLMAAIGNRPGVVLLTHGRLTA